ncbi:DUF4124 domain-containing protein [uncultured Shewanella sp.]|uniref:DUF4124 domain-containing protein n=1 Tax=uncultured Shewanella sp. TaxID=173975 RepID=UPI0026296FC5|nr:DUF4124 domain-containing protein [uncultured Shewanella sp.]
MARVILIFFTCLTFTSLLVGSALAGSIYKCIKDDKVVFSQTSCPKEFSQRQIEYDLGITTEIDSDKPQNFIDPLSALLDMKTISKEKLMQLINAEMYRLKQENSYFDILRASEEQKIERKRYWQKKEKDNPEYLSEMKEMHLYFDDLIANNQKSIDLLQQRKALVQAEEKPESTEK